MKNIFQKFDEMTMDLSLSSKPDRARIHNLMTRLKQDEATFTGLAKNDRYYKIIKDYHIQCITKYPLSNSKLNSHLKCYVVARLRKLFNHNNNVLQIPPDTTSSI